MSKKRLVHGFVQPIFSRNMDISKNAFINWQIDIGCEIVNLLVLADGFMASAIELSKICLADNQDKKADVLIFPILNNVNHGIELYLKAILWTLNKIADRDSKVEGGHNIKQIYQSLNSRIKVYGGKVSIESFNEQTVDLKAYIDELFIKINATPDNDRMDFSRYPFSRKYMSHFYVAEISNVEIDLENFVARFEKIHQNLEILSSYLFYHELSHDW